LTSVGERGYETAFAQLLASEGYRVLHAPVHHPFEHGKDIIALGEGGSLHAFQLKGGDIGLSELEDLQGQLFALTTTAVRYPGVEPPRPPDRAYLVTSGRLTTPARDRLATLNDTGRLRGTAPIEVIEKDQLVGRLVRAHGEYLPQEIEDLSQLLRFLLADGRGPFPVQQFAALLATLLAEANSAKPMEVRRAFTTATILTSYVAGPWQRRENHLGIAEAWLTLTVDIMRLAESADLDDAYWLESFKLARDSARRALVDLLSEAAAAADLVIPDIVDGIVYPARATLVCGYAAALLLSEREMEDPAPVNSQVKALIMRERPYIRAHGECAAAPLLLVATALELLGEPFLGAGLIAITTKNLVTVNAPGSEDAVPDPYHSVYEILLHQSGADTTLSEEQFAGEAYTLHVLLEWLARRGFRTVIQDLWPAVTRMHFGEFRPSAPANLLAHDDPDGQLNAWAPSAPQSWSVFAEAASVVQEASLPTRLWQHLEIAPYLPLVYPYRLTSDVAKRLTTLPAAYAVWKWTSTLMARW
jgi:hypothetical protein